MVAQLPALADVHQLHVADVLTGLQQHGVDEGPLFPAVLAHQVLDGLPGLLHRLENFVRHEAAVVLVQGIKVHVLGHVQGEVRDDQSFRLKMHMRPYPSFVSLHIPQLGEKVNSCFRKPCGPIYLLTSIGLHDYYYYIERVWKGAAHG